jgi:hypothetical protein
MSSRRPASAVLPLEIELADLTTPSAYAFGVTAAGLREPCIKPALAASATSCAIAEQHLESTDAPSTASIDDPL